MTAVAWSPDGRTVYTASRSLQQKRWDVGAGACRRSWKARLFISPQWSRGARYPRHAVTSGVACVRCSAVHYYMHRTAIARCTITAHDDQYKRHRAQGHRAPVADLAVDGSGGLLASGSADRSVRIWDVDRGYCTHAFEGHTCVSRPPQAFRAPRNAASHMCRTAWSDVRLTLR